MGRDNMYGGLIWTNHAMERLDDRWLTQEMALSAFRTPDFTSPGNAGSTKYTKDFGDHKVTVVAKLNEKMEWLVLSLWTDPPIPGSKAAREKEEYHKFRKSGFWGKFWFAIKKQLGF